MFVKTLLLALFFPCLISTEPIELTDQTWKKMLDGQWMVEFYAPWCSACQKFKPIWNDFSKAMSSKHVKVAAIDTDKYPSLSNRFRIAGLPTVFYVRNGVFRQFEGGDRSLNSLKKYITNEDWLKTEPIPSYIAPDSIIMSFVSSNYNIHQLFTVCSSEDVFTILQDEYKFPAWTVYIIIAIASILVAFTAAYSIASITHTFVDGLFKIYTKFTRSNENETEKLLEPTEQTTATNVTASVVEDHNGILDEEVNVEEEEQTESN
ncbi:unnamed protein product [Adineta steineri]|uniref:Thioredoxin domain-containing protein n=2 Tax=Adineta steineri TaxID=433720 RepID=A0A814PTH4_9BILA|nr:unnamed protein product [Adineta steineri]